MAGRRIGVVDSVLCGDLSAGGRLVCVSLYAYIKEFNDERGPAGDVSVAAEQPARPGLRRELEGLFIWEDAAVLRAPTGSGGAAGGRRNGAEGEVEDEFNDAKDVVHLFVLNCDGAAAMARARAVDAALSRGRARGGAYGGRADPAMAIG